jgi:hypothetical protein
MGKEEIKYGNESQQRREVSYEEKEKEVLEDLEERGKTDYIVLRQPKNKMEYVHSKKRLRSKKALKGGAYFQRSDVPLVLFLNNSVTCNDYLLTLIKKGCELKEFKLSEATKESANKDQRIKGIVSYLEAQSQTIKLLKESRESARKIQEDFKKAQENQENQEKGTSNGKNTKNNAG